MPQHTGKPAQQIQVRHIFREKFSQTHYRKAFENIYQSYDNAGFRAENIAHISRARIISAVLTRIVPMRRAQNAGSVSRA